MYSADVTVTVMLSSMLWAFGFILRQAFLFYKFIKIQKQLQGNKFSLATKLLADSQWHKNLSNIFI